MTIEMDPRTLSTVQCEVSNC